MYYKQGKKRSLSVIAAPVFVIVKGFGLFFSYIFPLKITLGFTSTFSAIFWVELGSCGRFLGDSKASPKCYPSTTLLDDWSIGHSS